MLLNCFFLGFVICTDHFISGGRDCLLYNIDIMQVILNGIDSSLAGMPISMDCIFSVSEGEDAVSRLKPHKSEGSSVLATDHFIGAGRYCLFLVVFLLMPLRYMVMYQTASEDLL